MLRAPAALRVGRDEHLQLQHISLERGAGGGDGRRMPQRLRAPRSGGWRGGTVPAPARLRVAGTTLRVRVAIDSALCPAGAQLAHEKTLDIGNSRQTTTGVSAGQATEAPVVAGPGTARLRCRRRARARSKRAPGLHVRCAAQDRLLSVCSHLLSERRDLRTLLDWCQRRSKVEQLSTVASFSSVVDSGPKARADRLAASTQTTRTSPALHV